MATFTVNSEERVAPVSVSTRIFDRAFFFSIFLIFVVGGIWVTEHVLLYLVNKDIAGYQEKTNQGLMGADTEAINEVEDFVSRSNLVKEHEGRVTAPELLTTLEKSTIPQVRLTSYEYNANGTITISGLTTDYRFVAEQLLRYRQEESLKAMQVEKTERSESGELTFTFTAQFSKEVTDPSV